MIQMLVAWFVVEVSNIYYLAFYHTIVITMFKAILFLNYSFSAKLLSEKSVIHLRKFKRFMTIGLSVIQSNSKIGL